MELNLERTYTLLTISLIPYFIILVSVLFTNLQLFNIPIIYLAIVGIVLLCLFKIIIFPVIRKDSVVILWLLFITASLVSFFYVQNIEHATSGLRVYLTMFIAYSMHLFFPLNKKQIYSIIGIYLTILAFFVLLSLYNVFQSPDLLNHRSFIGTGWIRSNTLASMWSTAVPISIAFFVKSKKLLVKLYFAFITLLFIFGIILVTSRGGFLALLLSLVLFFGYYFYKKKDNFKRILLVYLIIVFLLISIPILLQNPLFLNLLDRTSVALSGDSNGRFLLWKSAIEAWGNNILFGNGFYNLNEFMNLPEETRAHNFILNTLTDTGIVGTILYIAMLITLIRKLTKCNNILNDVIMTSILISLIVTIMHGLLEPTLTVLILGVLFWLKAGMLQSLYK